MTDFHIRAWIFPKQQMHYHLLSIQVGILEGRQIAKSIILNNDFAENYYWHKNFELMRGLGFTDINGSEIFEKDIVVSEKFGPTSIDKVMEVYGKRLPLTVVGNAYEPPCSHADNPET